MTIGGRGLLPVGEAGQHGVDDGVQRQTRGDVQFGGEPHLGVDHIVGRQILGAFGGDPVQRLRGLHDGDGVRERLQVADQRSAVRGGGEPPGQIVDLGGGQRVVTDLGGDVEHGGRPQPAVEMVVQHGLGGLGDEVSIQAHEPIRSTMRGLRAGGAPTQ